MNVLYGNEKIASLRIEIEGLKKILINSNFSVPKQNFIGNSHANTFAYCLLLGLHNSDRIERLQQSSYGLQSLKYSLSGHLQKTFANPCFKNCSLHSE